MPSNITTMHVKSDLDNRIAEVTRTSLLAKQNFSTRGSQYILDRNRNYMAGGKFLFGRKGGRGIQKIGKSAAFGDTNIIFGLVITADFLSY